MITYPVYLIITYHKTLEMRRRLIDWKPWRHFMFEDLAAPVIIIGCRKSLLDISVVYIK